MKGWRSLVLAPLALLAVGCGSLRVEVAVLDPVVLDEAHEEHIQRQEARLLREELPRILDLGAVGVQKIVDDLVNEHFSSYIRSADRLDAVGMRGVANQLQDDFAEVWVPEYRAIGDALADLARSIGKLESSRRSSRGEDEDRSTRALILDLRHWQSKLDEIRALAARDIDALTDHLMANGLPMGEIHTLVEGRRQNTAQQVQRLSILSSGSLDADPLVAAVADATDQEQDTAGWNTRFHKVIGRGYFGNFNMAIKMEKGPSESSFPEFTLKGLTFDPSDVARMASRVTSQALALGARMAGVDLGTPQAASSGSMPAGSAIASTSSSLGAESEALARSELAARVHSSALQRLGVTALQAWDQLTGSEAGTRKAAIAALRASFQALGPSLRQPAGGTGAGQAEAEPDEAAEDEDGAPDVEPAETDQGAS